MFFDSKCEFRGLAILDVIDLVSGGREALKAINNVETRILPIRLRFWVKDQGGRDLIYEAFEDQPAPEHRVVILGARAQNGRDGHVVPFIIRPPRSVWPAHPGEDMEIHLSASIAVEYQHLSTGKIERHERTAVSYCKVLCR